jgi:hypothetical protein
LLSLLYDRFRVRKALASVNVLILYNYVRLFTDMKPFESVPEAKKFHRV